MTKLNHVLEYNGVGERNKNLSETTIIHYNNESS